MSAQDKEYLKQNVLLALDATVPVSDTLQQDQSNKVIVSSLENIIYNIAQLDYLQWNGGQAP